MNTKQFYAPVACGGTRVASNNAISPNINSNKNTKQFYASIACGGTPVLPVATPSLPT